MTKKPTTSDDPVIIKKYANRRLYNTATSAYVTLEDLAELVKHGVDFVVHDAKSGEELTRSVLTQIIFEQEGKGQSLLPINFLRQLISFYGDSMQTVVPGFLDHSLRSLSREQERFREQISETLGQNPFRLIEDQVQQNMAMFEKAMEMFVPKTAAPKATGDNADDEPDASSAAAGSSDNLSQLREQLDAMQRQLDGLTKEPSGK